MGLVQIIHNQVAIEAINKFLKKNLILKTITGSTTILEDLQSIFTIITRNTFFD